LLNKDESVSVTFPNVRAVEMIEHLAESFKMKYDNIRSHAANIRVSLIVHSLLKSAMPQKRIQLQCEVAFQKGNQMLILLWSKGRPKFHINKVSLGHFYCNVQFCVGYGRDI